MFCIYAEILGVRKYVCEFAKDNNGKYLVGGYCLLPEEAVHFDNFNAANNRIAELLNPQNRDFKVQQLKTRDVGGKLKYNYLKNKIAYANKSAIAKSTIK